VNEPAPVDEPIDASPHPTTPEAQAWLAGVYAAAADGSLFKTPSIREQLSEHYKRVGLSD
jgi:hypothetical protein